MQFSHGIQLKNSLKEEKIKIAEWCKGHYRQNLKGDHGIAHWSRVYNNLKAMNRLGGHQLDYYQLFIFAMFHDVERTNEHEDHVHGPKGARLVEMINGKELISMSRDEQADVSIAIELHSEGCTEGTHLQKTCWDGDRLDLWRVGIVPKWELICTKEGKAIHKKRLETYFYEDLIPEHFMDGETAEKIIEQRSKIK